MIYGLEQSGFRYGDTLAIQGAGGLGIYMSAVAKQMGAARVIVLDRVGQRLEVARAFGADETVDLSEVTRADDRIARVRELTDGWGADVVAEVSGAAAAWPEGIEMVGRGGVYLTMGAIGAGQESSLIPPNVIRPSKRVIGVAHFDRDTLRKALQFLLTTRETYPYQLLTGDQYPLDGINEAFAAADARRATRASIVMGND